MLRGRYMETAAREEGDGAMVALLKGTPEGLKQKAPSDVEILSLEPGETITV